MLLNKSRASFISFYMVSLESPVKFLSSNVTQVVKKIQSEAGYKYK